MKIVVLGSGLVGAPMALDLSKDKRFEVFAVDADGNALDKFKGENRITPIKSDLSDPAIVKALVAEYDLVVNAVPGHMGFLTLDAIIEAGKDVVDIAFFPEDPFLLDEKAREKGITAIVDCGVAPGMSNILIGHVDRLLDKTDTALIYVGGLPEIRRWPYEYKAVFSPYDVIEEYVRPARYVENGKLVTRPALTDAEYIEFPGIGTLEAFNTDGLRTLAVTIDAPNLKEKTLRYPGHIEKMAVLRETGFFDTQEIEVKGVHVRPLDVTARLLFPMWEMNEDDRDITVMQVIIEGEKNGQNVRYVYDMLDRFDTATKTRSMARTTGYTATVAVRMMAEGLFTRKGICPPEFVGQQPECVEFMLNGLEERGIYYRLTQS